MWHFTFDSNPGYRIRRYGWAVTTEGRSSKYESLFWNENKNKWLPCRINANFGDSSCSHCHGIKTFRAFKRHLRKHPELKTQKVIWVNRYIGFNITAEWK